MIKPEQLAAMVAQNPQMQQASDQMEQQLMQRGISIEAVIEVIKALEFVLENPDQYQMVLQTAIQKGFVSAGDLPEEFNEKLLLIMLAALHDVASRMSQQQPQPMEQQAFAHGGLAQIASMGRGGDTMLAHINPREAAVLKAMGGSGTVNPNTGLREFKGGGGFLGDIVKIAVPIAANIMFPGLGIVGSALLGGATSALTGGNFAQGALGGALGGGLGSMIGGGASGLVQSMGGSALSGVTQNLIGNSLAGGLGSMAQGKGFEQGALMGGLGTYAGSKVADLAAGNTGALGRALTSGGKTFGDSMAAGYTPQQALLGSLVSGGMSAAAVKPLSIGQKSVDGLDIDMGAYDSQLAKVNAMSGPEFEQYASRPSIDTMSGPEFEVAARGGASPQAATGTGTGIDGTNLGLNKATGSALMNVGTLAALGSMSAVPQDIAPEIQKLSPSQQEYFNRPNQYWDWGKLMSDAQQQNMPLSQYMSSNWQNITGGAYNKPDPSAQAGSNYTPAPMTMASGGLAMMRLAQGGGSGRDDTIDARLSDGEYVMDAETVAMLGDGSTKAGAMKLNQMREKLRQHKGRNLAKGKISANAKSPLNYIAEVA